MFKYALVVSSFLFILSYDYTCSAITLFFLDVLITKWIRDMKATWPAMAVKYPKRGSCCWPGNPPGNYTTQDTQIFSMNFNDVLHEINIIVNVT